MSGCPQRDDGESYLASRNALVVEHEGQVIAVALMHDRPIGLWRNVVSGGYRLFRYASPLLVADFAQASYDGDQIAIDNGDFDWYLEILSVDKRMQGRGVGRWLVAKVLPDFVAKRGGAAYGLVTCTESNARFYTNGGCELLGRAEKKMRDEPSRFGPSSIERSFSDDGGLAVELPSRS